MSTELTVTDNGSATLFVGATPGELLGAATETANALHDVIVQKRLFQRIGRSEHVLVEGWQALGTLVGVFAVRDGGVRQLEWPSLYGLTERVEDPGPEPRRSAPEWAEWKFAADKFAEYQLARALNRARGHGLAFGYAVSYKAVKDGREVGWGEGRCTRAEANWRDRDDYALASMAQTRGQSRALRQPLGFIVALAGYAATPAEEMNADEPDTAPPAEAVAILSDADMHAVAGELQRAWPNLDAHTFLRMLSRRLGDGIPEPAGVALRAWAWWWGRPPESELATPQTPPDEPTDPPEPPTEEE